MRMTYEQITNMIRSMGVPSTYYQWNLAKSPPLPYIVYYYDGRNDFVADNRIYQKIISVVIELYSNEKNFVVENRIETILDQHEIPYTKQETYISSENLYEEIYEMEILLQESEMVLDGDPCVKEIKCSGY